MAVLAHCMQSMPVATTTCSSDFLLLPSAFYTWYKALAVSKIIIVCALFFFHKNLLLFLRISNLSPIHQGLGGAGGCWTWPTNVCLQPRKATCILGYNQSSVGSRAKQGILPLCSVQIRTHPSTASRSGILRAARTWASWSRSQRRADKPILELEDLCYGEGLRQLGLFSMEKRRFWRYHIAAWQSLKMACKNAAEGLFSRASCDRPRNNGFKLKEHQFKLDIRKTFYSVGG